MTRQGLWKQIQRKNEPLKRIAELEKENTELKERLGILNLNGNIAIRDLNDQLTKARKLLKRWLKLYNTNTVKGIIADTEQFLKETQHD